MQTNYVQLLFCFMLAEEAYSNIDESLEQSLYRRLFELVMINVVTEKGLIVTALS